MAGIVGMIGRRVSGAALLGAARLLCHGPGFATRGYAAGEVGLAAAYREDDPPSDVWEADASVGVIVYGCALAPGSPGGRLEAPAVAARYLKAGVEAVCELDGAFVIAILDRARRRLHLVNDRTATLPVKVHSQPGCLVVAPEAKAIHALLGTPPKLDPAGVLSFVATGHGLGRGTMLSGIRLLEPAQVLTVSLDTGEHTQRSYWILRFQPPRRSRATVAAAELHRVLLECHTAALADAPSFVQVLLTGGYDSRAMLGYLAAAGRPPTECLTWGASPSVPASDPVLAREMAAAQGVPWRFLPYDAEAFGSHLDRWVAISELESDNLGNYAAGHDFLRRCGDVAPVMLIGDQLLGTGGLPLNQADAFESVIGLPPGQLGPGITGLLRPEAGEEATAVVWSRAREALRECPHEAPKDVQDYLGLQIRLARWLNAPTYFREPMVSPRRPMLLRPALEFFQTLPARLRVDKQVLVTTLRKYQPQLFAFPKAAADSLVDWPRAFSDPQASAGRALRDLLAGDAVFDLPVGPWLDPGTFAVARDAWFSRVTPPVDRRPQPGSILPALRRFWGRSVVTGRALRWTERVVGRCLGRRSGPRRGVVLVRLGLAVALQRQLEGLLFRSQPAAEPGPPLRWPCETSA